MKPKRNRKLKIPHTFLLRGTILQLIQEYQIKRKAVRSLSSRNKKEDSFCTVYFVRRNCFDICVLSRYIVY